MSASIAILAFPKVTQLDLTGPYEVFSRMQGTTLDLVWKDTGPIASDTGFVIQPTMSFEGAGQYDVIVVPCCALIAIEASPLVAQFWKMLAGQKPVGPGVMPGIG